MRIKIHAPPIGDVQCSIWYVAPGEDAEHGQALEHDQVYEVDGVFGQRLVAQGRAVLVE